MLTFYRSKNCPGCIQIEETLKKLVLAHRIVEVSNRKELPEVFTKETSLPVMIDNGEVIQGYDAILNHLEQLEQFKELWDKYQSDACYCDEDTDDGRANPSVK